MLSKKLKYILLVVPIFYLIVSIFLLDREYGYLKIENDILPLNLLIPVNENSYLNDNDLTLTPNISGQCIYNSKTVSEAFKLRGIDFNDISIKNSDNSFKTIFDLRCWGRYIGSNIPQFSNLDSFQETSLEIYYVTTPNPLIFVILLYLFYLLIKNIETISRSIYFVLKKYLQNQNFYFWCLAFFILVEFKYFINSKFVMSYSFLLLIFYCVFSLIFFRKFKSDNKDKYLYPVFILIGLFYLIFEAKIDLFNFYIESDYYISMRGLLAVQSTYEQSLLNHNYFMEEFGAGQRLVGQWGNNYLPRILIFKMISNSDLAYFIYICVHYLISFYILLLASNRYLNNKFTSLLAVSLFVLSNITILWTQLTHMPPTLLSFSILLLSITYLRDKKFNIFYILSFIGFLILFQVSNIQLFVYVAGITAGLILIVFIEKKLHYSQIPKLFIGFFAAIPFGYKPIKLYFETLAFSARTSYEVNPEKYIMTSEHFKSLFRFDNYSNYFIEGNSDLYFSFSFVYIFSIQEKYRSDYQIKFLFFVICFFVLVSTDFLISALINFNPIFQLFQIIREFGVGEFYF